MSKELIVFCILFINNEVTLQKGTTCSWPMMNKAVIDIITGYCFMIRS